MRDGFNDFDLDGVLGILSDHASAAEELRFEVIEGEVEILRPPFPPLRLRLSRVRERFLHRFKTRRSKP